MTVSREVKNSDCQPRMFPNATVARGLFNNESFELDATRGAKAVDIKFRSIETLARRGSVVQEAANAIIPETYNCNRLIELPAYPAIRDLIDHDLTTNEATLAPVILRDKLSWFHLSRMLTVEVM